MTFKLKFWLWCYPCIIIINQERDSSKNKTSFHVIHNFNWPKQIFYCSLANIDEWIKFFFYEYIYFLGFFLISETRDKNSLFSCSFNHIFDFDTGKITFTKFEFNFWWCHRCMTDLWSYFFYSKYIFEVLVMYHPCELYNVIYS